MGTDGKGLYARCSTHLDLKLSGLEPREGEKRRSTSRVYAGDGLKAGCIGDCRLIPARCVPRSEPAYRRMTSSYWTHSTTNGEGGGSSGRRPLAGMGADGVGALQPRGRAAFDPAALLGGDVLGVGVEPPRLTLGGMAICSTLSHRRFQTIHAAAKHPGPVRPR